jgi:hypothetical protein
MGTVTYDMSDKPNVKIGKKQTFTDMLSNKTWSIEPAQLKDNSRQGLGQGPTTVRPRSGHGPAKVKPKTRFGPLQLKAMNSLLAAMHLLIRLGQ